MIYKTNKLKWSLKFASYFLDYNCHLRKCTRADEKDGCKAGIRTYKDELKRDYPSFGQVRAAINKNSKSSKNYKLALGHF